MAKSLVGKRTRQLLVFLHVAVSVGWMGAGAANVVLAVTAAGTGDDEVRRVCYRMIEGLDTWLVIPGAVGALVSGLALSLVTPWGFARYWWVLVKLVLTIVAILFGTFGLGIWVAESIEATAMGSARSPVAEQLVWGAASNIVSFLFMVWASVAKPWGKTPWFTGPTRTARSRPAPVAS